MSFGKARDYALDYSPCQPAMLLQRAKLIRRFSIEVMLFGELALG
ncbi:hypothetical protein [Cupriavidus necator]|nr:hypothetical protein [Cupriavidus necator]